MISAVVLTHNSSRSIKKTLESLSFCSEIIVVDDNSTDNTVAIAKENQAKVITRKLTDFSETRNFALAQARNDWVLYVDSDEVVSRELQNEILLLLQDKALKYEAFYLRRLDFFWGKPVRYGEVWQARRRGFIRLVKKDSGHFVGQVHERFVTDKATGRLKNCLFHYPHRTISDFLVSINLYSSLRARELKKKGETTNLFFLVIAPFFKFIYSYFLLLGFLDGKAGFTYSFMMSFHSFLVRSKLMVHKSP